MRDPMFVRGLNEVRNGQPFDTFVSGNIDSAWNYERGRQFGRLAPPTLSLFVGRKLNPAAEALFTTAVAQRLIT